MTYRIIRQWPDQCLKNENHKVSNLEGEDILIQDLIDTCNIEMGVGLAAPQIGINKKVVVLRPKSLGIDNPDPSVKNPDFMVLINPELHNTGDQIKWTESCLSLRGVTGKVSRYTETMISYLNDAGEEKKLIAEWPLSGAIQHECDHLEGKLFVDRMKKGTKMYLLQKVRKKRKKEARLRKKALKGDKK